jgi:hypothetical protein
MYEIGVVLLFVVPDRGLLSRISDGGFLFGFRFQLSIRNSRLSRNNLRTRSYSKGEPVMK